MFLHSLNLLIRSLLFSIISNISVFIYSIICVVAYPFFSLPYRYKIITSFTWFVLQLLKILCRINYKVDGLENIPQDRSGVILSKHQSTWETFFLPVVFKDPAIILKRELLWVPFFGWGLATVNPIAIDRKKKGNAMEQVIAQGKECLKAGRWILVFPEGTRVPYGQIGNYRSGGARLAVAAGCPVIPVAHNAGRFWPKRKFIKQPGTIHIVIGPLIETKNRKPDEVLAEAKNWIETTVKRIDTETRKASS